MKEYKIGEKIILKKKCRVLEVKDDFLEENCVHCYYFSKKKCRFIKCTAETRNDQKTIFFDDITDTFPENNKLLLERGLLKL